MNRSTNNSRIIEKKSQLVSSLVGEIKQFETFLVFEYLGLTSEEVVSLRNKFRETNSKLIIHKNNTLNRAFKQLNISKDNIKGPNAILLTKKDIKPFQDIVKMSKEKSFLKLKLAYIDNELIENENLNLLASLGSKEDLIVKFCRTLMSPVYKFAFLVKNISK